MAINEIDIEVYNKTQLLHALSVLDLDTVGTITLIRKNGRKTVYRFDYRPSSLSRDMLRRGQSTEKLREAVRRRVKVIKRAVRRLPPHYFT